MNTRAMTWQVYYWNGPLGGVASGSIPAAAVATFAGAQSGYIDRRGVVSNCAPSSSTISSNPASQYMTNLVKFNHQSGANFQRQGGFIQRRRDENLVFDVYADCGNGGALKFAARPIRLPDDHALKQLGGISTRMLRRKGSRPLPLAVGMALFGALFVVAPTVKAGGTVTTQYTYDAGDHIATVTDPRGLVTA